MKKLIVVLAVACVAPSLAYGQTPAPAAAVSPVTVSGSITAGVQQVDSAENSSKLTEYRDIRDDFYVSGMAFRAFNTKTGHYFAVNGANVSRNDQTILSEAGRIGVWRARLDWFGTPHNLSNKAVTPYIRSGPGLFTVPATVPITYKKLATAAADTAGVLASDDLIAAYQTTFLRPTPLGTQTNQGHLALVWSGSDVLSLGMNYDRREKIGLTPTFGPIGDRPPRSLNIQLTEPVDYRTNDLSFSAEHKGSGYQIRGEYLLSDFANQIDTLQWQNVYATGSPGASNDTWDRSVSTYGRRPLPPDNRYHTVSAMVGGDLPLESRFTATAAYGRLEQNATLLPYSFNEDQLAVKTLPRSTAEALIQTTTVTADYVINPVRDLNLRGFFRQVGMNNETPSSQWQYVTSDTSNLNGTVAYVNKRVSLPYAADRQNAGAEATWRLPARSSLMVGYEREALSRDFREADTTEQIVRATWRTRVNPRLSLKARYLIGARDGGDYFNQVTQEGYWYTPADGPDNNNPALTFDNHPDMRRYDVSDRKRHQADATVSVTASETMSVSAYVRYRLDDFDSKVAPSQPLLGTGLAEATATSPGNQLGLLKDKRLRYGVDMFTQPSDRISFNLFLGADRGTSVDRSMEFNENNKANPSTIATAELGPWTRATNTWTADFVDMTWSGGAGTTVQLVPNHLSLAANYSFTLADVDITYAGYGVTNFDGTPFPANHQFAFSSPPTIREDQHVVDLRFEIPVSKMLLIVGYTFDKYTLEDWQQGSSAPWVESVGADTLLRDTSRSFQWGNRLFNLGTYLAPGYTAHLGFVGFQYRF